MFACYEFIRIAIPSCLSFLGLVYMFGFSGRTSKLSVDIAILGARLAGSLLTSCLPALQAFALFCSVIFQFRFQALSSGSLFTGSFRNWMRKRLPSKCCKLPVSVGTVFCGTLGRKSGHVWMASARRCANISRHSMATTAH